MDEKEIKDLFHSVFNKINNISFVAGVNKKLLQQEKTTGVSPEQIQDRTRELTETFSRIEENAALLEKALRDYYQSLTVKSK